MKLIKILKIDFTSLCNAECIKCGRYLNGKLLDCLQSPTSLSLENLETLLIPEVLETLDEINFNGSYGDAPYSPLFVQALDLINNKLATVNYC